MSEDAATSLVQEDAKQRLSQLQKELEEIFEPMVDRLSDEEIRSVLTKALRAAESSAALTKKLQVHLDPDLFIRVQLPESDLDDLSQDEREQVSDLIRQAKVFAARCEIASIIANRAEHRGAI